MRNREIRVTDKLENNKNRMINFKYNRYHDMRENSKNRIINFKYNMRNREIRVTNLKIIRINFKFHTSSRKKLIRIE
jgi:hypothetical protein